MHQEDIQNNDTNYSGWRFCEKCDNMLVPLKGDDKREGQDFNTNIVVFKCGGCADFNEGDEIVKKDLNNTVEKNYQNIEDYLEQFLIKRQVFQRTRGADIFQEDMVDDPTMQTEKRQCLKCDNNHAKFYLKQNVAEDCIIKQYICCSCRSTWNANDEVLYKEQLELQQQLQQQQQLGSDIDDLSDNQEQNYQQQEDDEEQDDADLFGSDKDMQD